MSIPWAIQIHETARKWPRIFSTSRSRTYTNMPVVKNLSCSFDTKASQAAQEGLSLQADAQNSLEFQDETREYHAILVKTPLPSKDLLNILYNMLDILIWDLEVCSFCIFFALRWVNGKLRAIEQYGQLLRRSNAKMPYQ